MLHKTEDVVGRSSAKRFVREEGRRSNWGIETAVEVARKDPGAFHILFEFSWRR